MEENKIIKLENEINKKKEEMRIHLRRLNHIKSILPKPKGIFIKKCPLCGKKLVKDRDYVKYFRCKCGYEYYDMVFIYD